MTKAELIQALESTPDDVEVIVTHIGQASVAVFRIDSAQLAEELFSIEISAPAAMGIHPEAISELLSHDNSQN